MKFKDIQELEKYYKQYQNKTLKELRDVITNKFPDIKLVTNKGIAGQVLEALIGNPPNSNPKPDVEDISVELKVLPLRKINNSLQPKERSKIKSINYSKIVIEDWISSELKGKMETILFLLYDQPTGKTYKDWEEFIFMGTMLYELARENENQVQEDWEGIKYKVKSEKADQLSEGQTEILGASTSGTGKLVGYGRDKVAKQRSYSLKHSYLKVFYKKNIVKKEYYSLNLEKGVSPEDFIVKKLNKELSGKKLIDLVSEYMVNFSEKSKSSFRLLVNRILEIEDKKEILELELEGILIKTIPVDDKGNPWESMSFPKFSLVDLITENWNGDNEASFKTIISNGFIFIPLIKEKEVYNENGKKKKRFKNWHTWEFGNAFFWKADDDEMKSIVKEWKLAKKVVSKGVKVNYVKHGSNWRQENNLLKQSKTKVIHIRPHAINSKDIDKPYFDYTNGDVSISWQSFWLNKKFIGSKVKEHFKK